MGITSLGYKQEDQWVIEGWPPTYKIFTQTSLVSIGTHFFITFQTSSQTLHSLHTKIWMLLKCIQMAYSQEFKVQRIVMK